MAKSAHKSKAQKPKNPTSKYYLKEQGPQINGSHLRHSSSSAGRFKLPEARP